MRFFFHCRLDGMAETSERCKSSGDLRDAFTPDFKAKSVPIGLDFFAAECLGLEVV